MNKIEDTSVKAPMQYGNNLGILLLKKFLHTKMGAKIGFKLGLKGFNKIVAEHHKFQRYATGNDKLKRGEFVKQIGNSAKFGIYKKAKLSFGYNSRVDIGGDLIGSLITGTSLNSISSPLPPKYIALSTATLTPAHGDTTLASETSVAGLGRALGTQGGYVRPTTLDGAALYTVTKTFTLTGSATTVVSAALFDASSTGNMFVEANLATSATMATNDTLAITWTVNF